MLEWRHRFSKINSFHFEWLFLVNWIPHRNYLHLIRSVQALGGATKKCLTLIAIQSAIFMPSSHAKPWKLFVLVWTLGRSASRTIASADLHCFGVYKLLQTSLSDVSNWERVLGRSASYHHFVSEPRMFTVNWPVGQKKSLEMNAINFGKTMLSVEQCRTWVSWLGPRGHWDQGGIALRT